MMHHTPVFCIALSLIPFSYYIIYCYNANSRATGDVLFKHAITLPISVVNSKLWQTARDLPNIILPAQKVVN